MNLSFLSEPAFWSVVIAALALLLSQLPPIRELLKGVEISISLPEQIGIWHYLGSVQILSLLDIDNSGARRVVIKKLEIILVDDQEKVWKLPVQNYISRDAPVDRNGQRPEYLMSRIILKPSENWNESVRCYRLWTDTEEETVNSIVSEVTSSINTQLPSENYVEADPKAVSDAVDLFRKQFFLHKGNYRLFLAAWSDNDKLLALEGFEFTLFETHISKLKSHLDEYKYGIGIYLPILDPSKNVWVRLRPFDDRKRMVRIYEKVTQK